MLRRGRLGGSDVAFARARARLNDGILPYSHMGTGYRGSQIVVENKVKACL